MTTMSRLANRAVNVAMLLLSFVISSHSSALEQKTNVGAEHKVDALAAQYVVGVRQQAALLDAMLKERLETILPKVMLRENIDMWLIISREYNEDPILKTMLPSSWMHARRRTIIVFVRDPQNPDTVLNLALGRYDIGDFYRNEWDQQKQPDQHAALVDLINTYKVENIAINESLNFGLADGLAATEKQLLLDRLPRQLQQKLVSSEPLAIAWLETRTPTELASYQQLVALTKAMIGEAFSNKVITPGKTSTEDVVWWLRQRSENLGLQNWFQPSVSLQRNDRQNTSLIIQPGDLLHVDFGLSYLRLNSDIQQHAYVLRAGEQDAPIGLKRALTTANQLQTLLTEQFKTGTTGNELLKIARTKAIAKGIVPTIYSHPIGPYGHNAGTSIGMWDNQSFVQGSGEWPLHQNTAYAIELNAKVNVAEWQAEIRIMLEENAWFEGNNVSYFQPRQTSLLLIESP